MKLKTQINFTNLLIIAGVSILAGFATIIPCLGCCLIFVVPAAAAVYAVISHNVTKSDLGEGLFVGAIGGVASGVGYSIGAGLLTIVVSMFNLAVGAAYGTGSFANQLGFTGIGIIGIVIIGLIIDILIFSIVGAIAGLITASAR